MEFLIGISFVVAYLLLGWLALYIFSLFSDVLSEFDGFLLLWVYLFWPLATPLIVLLFLLFTVIDWFEGESDRASEWTPWSAADKTKTAVSEAVKEAKERHQPHVIVEGRGESDSA